MRFFIISKCYALSSSSGGDAAIYSLCVRACINLPTHSQSQSFVERGWRRRERKSTVAFLLTFKTRNRGERIFFSFYPLYFFNYFAMFDLASRVTIFVEVGFLFSLVEK